MAELERKLTSGRPVRKSPPMRISQALACLLGHCRPGRLDFRFNSVEVEARPLLHRRELDRSHGKLLHLLLDKHEAPEFGFVPVEELLCPKLRPAIGPTRTLERIEAQVGQVRNVRPVLVTYPTAGLVDETILVVANAHGTQLAFREIQDFV